MTRVLVIEAAGLLWGSERALIDLVAGPSECEFAVCCPPRTPLADELARLGVRVFPHFVANSHRKGRLRRLQAALGVFWACLRFRPQVLHLNQAGALRIALPAAALLGLPMTAHIRLFEEIPYLAARRPDPARLRAVVAISKAVADEVKAAPDLAGLRIVQIYDPYALPEVEPSNGSRDNTRVVCAGRIEPMKGQERLLDALQALRDDGVSVDGHIAGEGAGDYVDRLKARAAAGGTPCTWLGFVADVPALLRSAGVLACPSERETLGRVVLEAWAAGAVPVVFGGSGGAAEIVREAGGGIIYDEQTPVALADGLRRALNLGASERAAMLARGRDWLAANCSPASVRTAFCTILEESAARAGR